MEIEEPKEEIVIEEPKEEIVIEEPKNRPYAPGVINDAAWFLGNIVDAPHIYQRDNKGAFKKVYLSETYDDPLADQEFEKLEFGYIPRSKTSSKKEDPLTKKISEPEPVPPSNIEDPLTKKNTKKNTKKKSSSSKEIILGIAVIGILVLFFKNIS
jgi:hypothetical protein